MKIEISGSGLLATAAVYALRETHHLFSRRCLHSAIQEKFYTCHSQNRINPIVGSMRKKGLSGYYHGVTPSEVLTNPFNQSALATLGLSGLFLPEGTNFVPRLVPRPLSFSLNTTSSNTDVKIMANSVVGNLTNVVQQGWINELDISDDICFSVGTISAGDGYDCIGRGVAVSKGAVFPVLQFDRMQLTIRPVFAEVTDIDFVSISANLNHTNVSQLKEKFKCALYLRFGILISEPKYWQVFCQLNIPSSYLINKKGLFEHPRFQENINENLEMVRDFCKKTIPNIEIQKNSKIVNGIHLGYERAALSDIPDDVIIIDTSLCEHPSKHPTIASYCGAFNKLKAELKV